jgi:hypothetical protein
MTVSEYLIAGGSSVANLKAMFEKKGPAADPFPKKTPGSAIGGSRASTATTQPEPAKVEAPQAQSVSNLKGVFGFEKKPEGGSTFKVGPPPAKASEPSWIKKTAEEPKAPITSAGLKPTPAAPANNPFKKADPPVVAAPVAPPKPVEIPKSVEQPKPSPF